MLDNDLLLNIFHFYPPAILQEDEGDDNHILEGGEFDRERRWYKFAHVCRRWRNLILDSPSHLSLSCLYIWHTRFPFHSSTCYLLVCYIDDAHYATAEQGEGIILALQYCNRVCRIRLQILLQNSKRLITAIDDEFPMRITCISWLRTRNR